MVHAVVDGAQDVYYQPPCRPTVGIPHCSPTCGFQSLSKMTTVSAVARLMPRPPALVLSRNAKSGLSGLLNASMA